MTPDDQITGLLDAIEASPRKGRRRIVALAGAPASGKSTLAGKIATQLSDRGHRTQVVPMDGFHISNGVLQSRRMLHRKGAPETFDLPAFDDLLRRVASEDEVLFPVFDRDLDVAIMGGGMLSPDTETAIVEGNYLLLDEPGWSGLSSYWDLSIFLDVPLDRIRQRLVHRWMHHGLDDTAAETRAETNDIPNAQRLLAGSVRADILYRPGVSDAMLQAQGTGA